MAIESWRNSIVNKAGELGKIAVNEAKKATQTVSHSADTTDISN